MVDRTGRTLAIASVIMGTIVSGLGVALADDARRSSLRISAQLSPTKEVPSLSSAGSGRFQATIDRVDQTISYELSYDDLEAATLQAHIHVGQKSVNGAISVFLCGNPPTVPPPAVPQPPACPAAPATVTGVITAAHIIGPAAQGIAPTSDTVNEFEELVALIEKGVTYANVHSAKFPGGEIRGQVRADRKHR